MRTTWRGFASAALASAGMAAMLGVAAAGLRAQGSRDEDARWVRDCLRGSTYHDDRRESRVCEVRVERVGAPGRSLDIDGLENGAVQVDGWDGDSIVVHALVQADAPTEDEAHRVASQVTLATTGGTIRANGPAERHRDDDWSVSYRIHVPRHMDLTARAVNGPVGVTGVTGRMDLRTENGPIELQEVGGDVHARGQNGPLEVDLGGRRWDGTGLDAETENGPVELRLPAAYAAHLETGTVNGPMQIDFPVTVQGRVDLQHLSMDIGGGGPPVRVITTNGPVTVRRD